MPAAVALTSPVDTSVAGGLTDCFHCGQPVTEPGRWSSRVGGSQRLMCCAGCQAVAEAIVSAGLDDYYRTRTILPGPGWQPPDGVAPREPAATRRAVAPSDESLSLYDEPEVQQRFVHRVGDRSETTLLVEGMRCGACVWLIEQQLRRQPGVDAVSVNLASERASLRFDPQRTALSTLLSVAARIGYRLRPFDPARREASLQRTSRDSFRRLFIAGLGMMQVMMYAVPAYLAEPGDIEAQWDSLMRWASLALTLPVVLYSAQPFFAGAWRDLRARSPGMDVPVAIAIAAAFAASVQATVTGRGEVWYDSVTMFVFLLLGARHLEWMARRRAARSLDALSSAAPEIAERIHPETGAAERIPAVRLAPGDLFRVAPGERIAVDAEILEGQTHTDQSLLTGESRAVPAASGDRVPGGAINTGHPVVLRAIRNASQSTISTIERLAERAAANRPRLVGITDRVARVFVLALLILAAVIWIGWLQFDAQRAGPIAIAVLVVSCPCALSLATPAALAAAGSAALRRGMLVASGDLLLQIPQATDVVFDKTGTLTRGEPGLIAIEEPDGRRPVEPGMAARLLSIAAALEGGQSHPMAEAIRRAAGSSSLPAITNPRTVPGQGVSGRVGGQDWRLGNAGFTGARLDNEAWADESDTLIWLADESGPRLRLRFRDVLRDDAASVVSALAAQGRRVHLLSGDHPATVAVVAAQLGIAIHRGGARPDDKLDYVRSLQREGRTVLMVGDGINDAPVLAAADVSVAVGEATSIARTAAGIVLLGQRLTELGRLGELAGLTRRIVRQNLAWAMAYNALAIPAAAIGWVPPAVAAIGMSASSLLVALNAARLTRA
jgi:P-type Cu2+ transporter